MNLNNIQSVEEFMIISGQYIFSHNKGLQLNNTNHSLLDLRRDLIIEELNELDEGLKQYFKLDNKESIIEIVDAICDLEYVFLGALLTYGIEKINKNDECKLPLNYESCNKSIIYTSFNEIKKRFLDQQLQFDLFNSGLCSLNFKKINDDSKKVLEESLHTIFYFLKQYTENILSNIICFHPSIIQECFKEVHKSNMSKFLTTEADAIASVNKYTDKNISCYYEKVGIYYVIKRTEDDKVLKGIHFKEPDLKSILFPYDTL